MAGLCSNLSNKFLVSYTKKEKNLFCVRKKESTKGFFSELLSAGGENAHWA